MAAKDLYADIEGVPSPLSIDIVEGYKSFSRICTVNCVSTTLSIGDSIVVDMGYADSHGVAFTGIVKKIHKAAPENIITLTCFDELTKATDYFLAAEDPDDPFIRTNIDAADLVGDLLAEADITNYTPIATSFVFTEPSFNLVSIADAINQVATVIAYHLWADENGEVFFADRRPYIMPGDTADFTFITGSSGNIITSEYSRSDDDLRNKVVVYGNDPIVATASEVSPYLPDGFFKTAVVASPLITEQGMAQDSADFNLELYNRLTRMVNCEAMGDHRVHVNDIISITESHTTVSGLWFLYSISHSWSDTGYTMRLGLRA
jgi:hypothetical protein